MLGNLQVAFVPVVAWLVLKERPAGRVLATLPLVLAGVVLVSGALEHGAYGADPAQGVAFGVATGLTYAGFILILRSGSGDLRRPAGPLFDATAVATVVAIAAGAIVGDADLVPTWPAHAWLVILALTSQVIGWLLISASLPRLPAALASLLLTLQPLGSLLLGALLFAEAPTALQLAGAAGSSPGWCSSRACARPRLRQKASDAPFGGALAPSAASSRAGDAGLPVWTRAEPPGGARRRGREDA